jgi:outer membrane protein assembly factor BamB
MVYVGSDDGYVYCLDAYTGALIWSYNTYGPVQSSPTVLDGVVYIGGFHSHAVFALNASTGALIWNSPVASAGPHMISATAVANGLVYVDVYMYSSYFGGELYALNASTGALVWDYQPAAWLPTSPVVSDGEVYVGDSAGCVTALDATSGDQLWSDDVCNYGVSNLCVLNGTVYVGTQTETVQALAASTGGTIWTGNVVGGVDSSCPAVSDGIVYVSTSYGGNSISGVHPGGLCALNAATGASIWNVTVGSIMQSSPAVADGVVFVGSDDTSIPFSPLIDGHSVYAFNGTTGAIIWSYATGGSVFSSPAIANGVVYVGSDDDKVYAFGSPEQVAPPQVSVLSPVNQVYSQTSVPLTFALDERVNWAGYSLDGRQDVTITGNTTLSDLASGSHSLVVYVNDTIGNVGASQTINFTVALPTLTKPEPFPALTVVAVSAAAVIVVVVGLLVHFNKHKHQA